MIPFNKPHLTGRETDYIQQAVALGKLAANGEFTHRCEHIMEERYGLGRCFFTTSCSAALEMAAMVCGIKTGDEVIVPSYTFVSTAMAFVRAGATVRFADSLPHHPNMDVQQVESLITPRTRAIVPVHYNGVSCDMDTLKELARAYNLYLIEDAAHCVQTPLGKQADMSCFSFHETKNIHCGEGGMLSVNCRELVEQAELIWFKGTNRKAFEEGKVSRYEWVAEGASFAPSEINAAFLYAQLEATDNIQQRRRYLWQLYADRLQPLAGKGFFTLPADCGSAHIFYLVCRTEQERNALAGFLFAREILAVSHYQSLHSSPYGCRFHDGRILAHAEKYTHCLLRLPLFFDLTEDQMDGILCAISDFYVHLPH